ncbi:hypothetical protein GCM10023148_42190 [Actinokineospora soli]
MTPRTALPDAALALLLATIGIIGTLGADRLSPLDRPVDTLALALTTTTALLLTLRRTTPTTTLLLVATLTSTYLILGYPYGPILLSFFAATYTAARHLPFPTALPTAAAALTLLIIHVFTTPTELPGLIALVPASAWVIVPFAIGTTVRQHQEATARARAETIHHHVSAERLRLAQEVHDVVGHSLAAIKMQADVALHLINTTRTQAEPTPLTHAQPTPLTQAQPAPPTQTPLTSHPPTEPNPTPKDHSPSQPPEAHTPTHAEAPHAFGAQANDSLKSEAKRS